MDEVLILLSLGDAFPGAGAALRMLPVLSKERLPALAAVFRGLPAAAREGAEAGAAGAAEGEAAFTATFAEEGFAAASLLLRAAISAVLAAFGGSVGRFSLDERSFAGAEGVITGARRAVCRLTGCAGGFCGSFFGIWFMGMTVPFCVELCSFRQVVVRVSSYFFFFESANTHPCWIK